MLTLPHRRFLMASPAFPLAAYAAANGGALFDFRRTATTWQDTAGTIPADDTGEAIGRIDDATGGAFFASQATENSRPSRQVFSGKGDGSDDALRSNWFAAAGANFATALVTVPASLASVQLIAGAAAGSDRGYFGVSSAGKLVGGVGTDTTSVVVWTTDLRGRRVVVGLAVDGSTVRLSVDGCIEYEGAQHGVMTTAHAWSLFAQNNAGSNLNFFGGYIERILFAHDYPSPYTLSRIATAMRS